MKTQYLDITISLLKLLGLATVVSLPAKAQDSTLLTDKDISVNGTNVHYKIGGSGPYLLLLHGFTLSGEQWLPFAEELADDYTLIIPDLPGHGQSEALKNRFTYEATAELMRGLLWQLNIKKVRGIGHSAGSIILMHMAAQDPNILEAMILNSGGHRSSKTGRQLAMEDRFEKADPAFQNYYLSIHPGGLQQIKTIFEAFNEMGSRFAITVDQAMLSPTILGRLDLPLLLIWGDRDPFFPLDVAMELYQFLPDARLWVIPDQHHVPIWANWGGDADAAERFISVAKEFFHLHTGQKDTVSIQN